MDLVLIISLLCHNCQNCGNIQLVLGIVDYLSGVLLIILIFVSRVPLSLTLLLFYTLCVDYKKEVDMLCFSVLYFALCSANVSLGLICLLCLPFDDIVILVRVLNSLCFNIDSTSTLLPYFHVNLFPSALEFYHLTKVAANITTEHIFCFYYLIVVICMMYVMSNMVMNLSPCIYTVFDTNVLIKVTDQVVMSTHIMVNIFISYVIDGMGYSKYNKQYG